MCVVELKMVEVEEVADRLADLEGQFHARVALGVLQLRLHARLPQSLRRRGLCRRDRRRVYERQAALLEQEVQQQLNDRIGGQDLPDESGQRPGPLEQMERHDLDPARQVPLLQQRNAHRAVVQAHGEHHRHGLRGGLGFDAGARAPGLHLEARVHLLGQRCGHAGDELGLVLRVLDALRRPPLRVARVARHEAQIEGVVLAAQAREGQALHKQLALPEAGQDLVHAVPQVPACAEALRVHAVFIVLRLSRKPHVLIGLEH
mmetsp:Transcript_69333/g.115642  ORF Transcript_69333/g.115642 Transcript_69333/m.115642 type:complete len:261 (+) Transcript_69333:2069-2851(+)